MKNIKLAVWIAVILILQTVLCKYIKFFGICPNIAFAFAMSVCVLDEGFAPTVTVSTVCGALLDALVNRSVGMYTIMFSYSAILCHAAVEKFFKPGVVMTFLATGISYFICNLIYMLLNFTDYYETGFTHIILFIILPSAAYTAVISVIVCFLLKRTVYRNSGDITQGGAL